MKTFECNWDFEMQLNCAFLGFSERERILLTDAASVYNRSLTFTPAITLDSQDKWILVPPPRHFYCTLMYGKK